MSTPSDSDKKSVTGNSFYSFTSYKILPLLLRLLQKHFDLLTEPGVICWSPIPGTENEQNKRYHYSCDYLY